MSLSREELIDMVFILGECQRNPLLSSRVYAERYPDRNHPQAASFARVLERFITTGKVDYNLKSYVKPVINEENEFLVLASVQENPLTSTRELSRLTEISKASVHVILKKYNYHPYHTQLHQELRQRDHAVRMEFCQWALNQLNEDEDFFKYVMFCDESTFHKNGFVNTHNFHYYDTVNPRRTQNIYSQYRWSLNVWGGVLGNHVIGPFFFDRPLTGRTYVEFLQNELIGLLDDVPLAVIQRMWLLQDGAPAHGTIDVRNHLDAVFPHRWIGRGGEVNWPARSPDLTPCDFFLWGYVKNKVYADPPTTVQNMQERVIAAFRTVTPEILANVEDSFKTRIRMCIQQNGGHFEHLS